MAEEKYDVNDPILVVIKRGRKGKGFIVTAADSDTPCPCMNAEDIGEVIIELLDDDAQPRLSADTVEQEKVPDAKDEQGASEPGGRQEAPADEPEPEQPEENPYAKQSETYNNLDPLDRLIVGAATKLFNFGRKASDYDHGRGR